MAVLAAFFVLLGTPHAHAQADDEYAIAMQDDECRLSLAKAKVGSDDWRLAHGEIIRPPYLPSQCRAIDEWRLTHGFRRETRLRLPRIISGAAIFGALYVATVIYAAGNVYLQGDAALYVPVAGPFIMVGFKIDGARTPVLCTSQGCGGGFDAFAAIAFGLDGLAQAVGVGLFIAGFARETVLAKVHIVPTVSKALTGLTVSMSL